MAYDLIIRNGKVIDGSGIPGFYGDVAISGNRIVEIGQVGGDARRVLDADGLVVAPGIIDNHTHYDAQVTWDPFVPSLAITAPPPSSSVTVLLLWLRPIKKTGRCWRGSCPTWKRSHWRPSGRASHGRGRRSRVP